MMSSLDCETIISTIYTQLSSNKDTVAIILVNLKFYSDSQIEAAFTIFHSNKYFTFCFYLGEVYCRQILVHRNVVSSICGTKTNICKPKYYPRNVRDIA